eukprot:4191498-Pleurochrysis_carterae.AAC.1
MRACAASPAPPCACRRRPARASPRRRSTPRRSQAPFPLPALTAVPRAPPACAVAWPKWGTLSATALSA